MVDRIQTQRGVKVDLRLVPEANHFFTGKIDAMTEEINDYLDTAVGDVSTPVEPV
jgi:alpha/beta superfamily hydrolase